MLQNAISSDEMGHAFCFRSQQPAQRSEHFTQTQNTNHIGSHLEVHEARHDLVPTCLSNLICSTLSLHLYCFFQAPCTGLHSIRRKHQHFSCHGLCLCISSDNSTLRLLHIWLLFILISILCFWSPGCPVKGTSPPPFIHYHIAQLIPSQHFL